MSDREAPPRPGFVGLGVIGGTLAALLRTHTDRAVLGLDTAPAAARRAAGNELTLLDSVDELAARADIVFLSLPGASQVESVCLGKRGLFAVLPPGGTVVDLSTVPVSLTRELGKAASAAGIAFADAPVAATAESAAAGQASLMVGAEAVVFRRISPLLAHMAAHVMHCGPVGSGGVTKLLLNAVVAQTGVALAEALTLSRRAGVDGGVLFDALGQGCDSFVLRHHGMKALLPGCFPAGRFSTRYMLKDLEYALALAAAHETPLPGTSVAVELLRAAERAGDGEAYWPVVIKQLEAANDL